MAKMMSKPKTGTKVKTIDRGQYAPNVNVEENPILRGPKLKDLLDANEKAGIGKRPKADSTSKMKKGGKVAKKVAPKMMMKKISKKK